MSARARIPVALTVAGSDSGGGAGIQADLNTFTALGVHGTSALTCITAQNPAGVRGIQPIAPRMVAQQIEAVSEELKPAACKTGMLYSAKIIETIASVLGPRPRCPLVVDPVIVSTSGALLLQPAALAALRRRLLPIASLMTPNVDETRVLAKMEITAPESLRTAARRMHEEFGCAVLVKGGHLRGLKTANDLYYDGRVELLLSAPFVRGVSTHGTGCTYSAAITAYCARGYNLATAVGHAKQFITAAIANSSQVRRHHVLNWKTAGWITNSS